MISDLGKTHIKRYMAGGVPSIAKSIAFGIGRDTNADTAARLQMEIGRADIVLTAYDFINNRLVFKAPVPDFLAGVVNEVAIYSTSVDDVAGEFGSQLISTFDSQTEDWLNITASAASTFGTTATRIGIDSLRQTPAINGSQTDSLANLSLDLSGHSSADKFNFAFNIENAFVSSIKFRFMTDASNYYDLNLGAQTAGYKIVSLAKSTAVPNGSPNWGNITELRIITNSTAGGSGSIEFDCIRIEDVDTLNPEYVMVAREVLATPFVKQAGVVQDIEFTLDISI